MSSTMITGARKPRNIAEESNPVRCRAAEGNNETSHDPAANAAEGNE